MSDNFILGDDDYIEIVVKTTVLEGEPITPREQQKIVPAHSTANERRGVEVHGSSLHPTPPPVTRQGTTMELVPTTVNTAGPSLDKEDREQEEF